MKILEFEQDILQRFIFPKLAVRGEIVHLKQSYQAIHELHDYPTAVAQLLGNGLAASSLLSATIKFDGSLIVQTHTDGAVNPLVVQADNQLHIRGMASWDKNKLGTAEELLGKGQLAISLIPNDPKRKRYQGLVQLEYQPLAKALETYFWQSEQLPTFVHLASNTEYAAGLLIQQIPDQSRQKAFEDWENIMHFAKTLQDDELLSLDSAALLHRLFPEEDIKLFEPQPVSFRCSCSLDKMHNAIRNYGYQEAMDIFKTLRLLNVTCEFCKRSYDFDKVDIETIFAQKH